MFGATPHSIQGNFIGTNAAGTATLPNGGPGVELIKSSDVLVGGDTAAAANVISGNVDGVRIDGGGGTKVVGNFIGTNPSGAGVFNTGSGVVILGGATGSTVFGNVIDRNGHEGISVLDGAGNAFLSNSIPNNGGLGIDLGGDGVTPNDPGDADTGPNERQNYPVITSVLNDGTSLFVRGTIEGRPAANTFRIQFFSGIGQDPSGFGEGGTYLGEVTVDVGASGKGEFSATLPAVPAGRVITATATGNPTSALPPTFLQTSEFSQAKAVPAADTTPPRVTGVAVNGTSWAAAFRRRLQETGRGTTSTVTSCRWNGPTEAAPLDQLERDYDRVHRAGGSAAGRPCHPRLERQPPDRRLLLAGGYVTWRLASPFGANRLTLELRSGGASGVKDLVGRALDGEWASGTSIFPSGNGTPGGDFLFNFNVLPGDVNRSGLVNVTDMAEARRRFASAVVAGGAAASPRYSIFTDLDGSGVINATDVLIVRRNLHRLLP